MGFLVTVPPLGVLQAIRDGVIEASINHEKGYVQSKEMIDIYSTREPQLAFHQRISFCLDIHNMSVKVRVLACRNQLSRSVPGLTWLPRRRLAWHGAQFPASISVKPLHDRAGVRGLCLQYYSTVCCF